jgi:hypothetical protein
LVLDNFDFVHFNAIPNSSENFSFKVEQNLKTHYAFPFLGALAQLVERNNGIVEVSGSIPLRSTFPVILTEIYPFHLKGTH